MACFRTCALSDDGDDTATSDMTNSDARYVELRPARTSFDNESTWYVVLLGAVALASGIANGFNGTVLEGTIPRQGNAHALARAHTNCNNSKA